MDITFYINNSEKNKISKNLTNNTHISGTLRNETGVMNPVILIHSVNPTKFNYVYIPEFNRYYFITDMVSIRTDIWQIKLHVDVLMSFKDSLKNVKVILNDSEVEGADNYLTGEQWVTNVKDTTNIVNFPNGLLDNGEYILITAGGGI